MDEKEQRQRGGRSERVMERSSGEIDQGRRAEAVDYLVPRVGGNEHEGGPPVRRLRQAEARGGQAGGGRKERGEAEKEERAGANEERWGGGVRICTLSCLPGHLASSYLSCWWDRQAGE
eukprot:763282-Hanusia_phi.AAC.4